MDGDLGCVEKSLVMTFAERDCFPIRCFLKSVPFANRMVRLCLGCLLIAKRFADSSGYAATRFQDFLVRLGLSQLLAHRWLTHTANDCASGTVSRKPCGV